MAPRNKFTRDEMVAAAVRVVRAKGAGALTARAVADELGVSTQPVFTCFTTMDEAKREVRAAAEKIYDGYAEEGLRAEIPFYGFGTQFIRFARDEPELYRLIFLTPAADGNNGAMEALEHSKGIVTESLKRIYNMNDSDACRYFRDMWLVVYSLATLTVTGGCRYSDAEIGEILTGFSLSVCKAIKEIPGFTDGSFDRDAQFRELIGK